MKRTVVTGGLSMRLTLILIALIIIPTVNAIVITGGFTDFDQRKNITYECDDNGPLRCMKLKTLGSDIRRYSRTKPTLHRITSQKELRPTVTYNNTTKPTKISTVRKITSIRGGFDNFKTNPSRYQNNCYQSVGNIICPGQKVADVFLENQRRSTLGGGIKIGRGLSQLNPQYRRSKIYFGNDYMRDSVFY